MTDKLKGDAGIRLRKEIAMGRKVDLACGGAVKPAAVPKTEKFAYQKYGNGFRKVKP